MNDDNQKQLNQILRNTAKTEERTRKIEKDLDDMRCRVKEVNDEQRDRINELEARTKKNSLVVRASILLVGIFLTAFSSWAFGVV